MFDVPKFNNKDDPALWLYRYIKAAVMIKWEEKTKLYYVDNCFPESLQMWFMQQGFKKWDDFKTTFIAKFTKRINFDKLVSQIINFKMITNESVVEYITRFEETKTKCLYETAKRKYQSEGARKPVLKESQSAFSNKVIETQGPDTDLDITETGFLNHFIKGIQSRIMKRILRTKRPKSLDEAYELLREVYGPEESDVYSESEDESNPKYEENSDNDTDTETKPKVGKKDISSKTKKTVIKDTGVSEFIHEFKNMTLLIGELVSKTN